MTLPMVSEGSANTTANDVARMAQQNSGIRTMDIPGARSLKMVTMKFTAPAVLEMPRKARPTV
jgi:hypothetical protein